MKKAILIISLNVLLFLCGLLSAVAQDKPVPKKDTVNIDTDAKPTFYYAIEDEEKGAKGNSGKSSAGTIAIIAGAVIVAGVAGYFLLRRKK